MPTTLIGSINPSAWQRHHLVIIIGERLARAYLLRGTRQMRYLIMVIWSTPRAIVNAAAERSKLR